MHLPNEEIEDLIEYHTNRCLKQLREKWSSLNIDSDHLRSDIGLTIARCLNTYGNNQPSKNRPKGSFKTYLNKGVDNCLTDILRESKRQYKRYKLREAYKREQGLQNEIDESSIFFRQDDLSTELYDIKDTILKCFHHNFDKLAFDALLLQGVEGAMEVLAKHNFRKFGNANAKTKINKLKELFEIFLFHFGKDYGHRVGPLRAKIEKELNQMRK